MWLPYSFIRFFVCFALGILLAAYLPVFYPALLTVFIVLCGAYFVALLQAKPEIRRRYAEVFGIVALLLTSLFGFVYTQYSTETNQPQHFSKQIPLAYYEVMVNSELSEAKSTLKAEAKVLRMATDTLANAWKDANGKLMLYFSYKNKAEFEQLKQQIGYGKTLFVRGNPTEIVKPMNPEEFDYRNYMANLQIRHYHFIYTHNFVLTGEKQANPIWKYALAARNYCDNILKTYIKNDEAYGLATALVLGVKQSLTDEIKSAYSNSGIMHILAVSGMHVTLLFQILMFFLQKLRKNRKTKTYTLLGALALLWFYAFITGLSASVLRAVVMFSFVLVAEMINRKINIYNILAVSAFVLCLADPYLLFDVGFQLSYLAVLGIVFFYPLISKFYTVPVPLKKKKEKPILYWFRKLPAWALNGVWQIICVSIAAQISTSPIALLYFHQFPNYFLLANLFAIPVSTLVMYGELLLLAFSWWHFAAKILGYCTEKIILFLNFGVSVFEKLPFATTSNISIAGWESWLLYLVIVLLVLLFYFRRLLYLQLAFALLCAWSVWQWVEFGKYQKNQQIIVYQTPKASALELVAANHTLFFASHDLLADKNKLRFHTYNYQCKRDIASSLQIPIEDSLFFYKALKDKYVGQENDKFRLLVFGGKKLLWLKKKLPFEAIPSADYWLVSSNNFPKFAKDIDSLPKTSVEKIIVDGSNTYYQIQKFKAFARLHNLPVHVTNEQGAWQIKL
jgi:competence protein ComEC